MSPQCVKHYPQMLYVLLSTAGIDQNVVDEDYYELIQVWPEDAVHKIHEYRERICYSKWHD